MKSNHWVLWAACLLFLFPCMNAADFSVYRLKCEQQSAPLCIEAVAPRFSWEIQATQRGFAQTAYQILVADSPKILEGGKGNLWDSGRTASADQILVTYAGKPLAAGQRYYYKVRIWSGNRPSAWSRVSMFDMGLLTKADWSGAQWIAYEKEIPGMTHPAGIHVFNAAEAQQAYGSHSPSEYKLPQFRKEFRVTKQVKRAMAYVSGLGQFALFLNGRRVSDHFLDPAWTKYDRCVRYVAFDVTDRLTTGANTVGVMLGNGFFNIPNERYYKLIASYGVPRMLLKMQVEYTDGSRETLVTNRDWKTTPSAVTFSSIYGGEDYDATKEQTGWTGSGFDDSRWSSALIADWDAPIMAQQSEPLTVREPVPVVRMFKNRAGKYVYDLGQNFSGIIDVSLRSTQSQYVKIFPAELLNPDSTVNQSATGEPYWFGYTTAGQGDRPESWRPMFSYYGFRYVQIEGAVPAGMPNPEQLPEITHLTGLHTTLAAENVGTFHCSDNLYNQIFNLIDWAIRSNMSSVLTDCPHREKLGWLEQAHLMQSSIQYNYNLSRLYPKIFDDMQFSQLANGLVPDIVPEYVRFEEGFFDSPEWGSAAILSPWNHWLWYGDKRALEQHYPMMQRYLEYLGATATDHIVSHGLGDWFDIGPKSPGSSQLTSLGVTSTAIYYMDAVILQKTAALLGKAEEAARYKQLAAEIYSAFNRTYWNKETGKYDRDSQTANAMALCAGLVPEENHARVVENLLNDIKGRNYALTAGDIGFKYLIRALEENGASEVISRMNSRYDVPGYGWQLAHGATACTESWQAYGFVSNNHMMLGHLMEWLYAGIGGLRPDAGSTAFRTFDICPEIVGAMTNASISFRSPYGMIRSEWRLSGKDLNWDIEVPAGTVATVTLPVENEQQVTESGMPVGAAVGVSVAGHEKGRLKLKVQSGSYHFEADGVITKQ